MCVFVPVRDFCCRREYNRVFRKFFSPYKERRDREIKSEREKERERVSEEGERMEGFWIDRSVDAKMSVLSCRSAFSQGFFHSIEIHVFPSNL